MSEGVLFYNWGTGCVPRLLVALYTCRQFYRGPATLMVLHGDPHLQEYRDDVVAMGYDVRYFEAPVTKEELKVSAKYFVFQASPYDFSVIYENDFLFTGDISPVFDLCRHTGFGVTPYHGIRGATNGVRACIATMPDFEALKHLDKPEAFVTNNGLVCLRRDHQFARDWGDNMKAWAKWTTSEEIIMNIWVNQRYEEQNSSWTLIPETFNIGLRYGRQEDVDRARALHYLGGRHVIGSRKNEAIKVWLDTMKTLATSGLLKCRGKLLHWEPALSRFYDNKL